MEIEVLQRSMASAVDVVAVERELSEVQMLVELALVLE